MPDTTPDDAIAAWLASPEPAARISPTPDLTELRRLAEAATPGPWETDRLEVSQHWSLPEPWRAVVNAEVACGPYCYGGSVRPIERDEDAAYIAAASPAVVLGLLDDILALEVASRGYRERAERAEETMLLAVKRADTLAATVERVREWLDHRGVDVGDRDDAYMDGYRAAQRHAVQDAAELRRALDGRADA